MSPSGRCTSGSRWRRAQALELAWTPRAFKKLTQGALGLVIGGRRLARVAHLVQRVKNLAVSGTHAASHRLQTGVLLAVKPQLGELEVGLGRQALGVS